MRVEAMGSERGVLRAGVPTLGVGLDWAGRRGRGAGAGGDDDRAARLHFGQGTGRRAGATAETWQPSTEAFRRLPKIGPHSLVLFRPLRAPPPAPPCLQQCSRAGGRASGQKTSGVGIRDRSRRESGRGGTARAGGK